MAANGANGLRFWRTWRALALLALAACAMASVWASDTAPVPQRAVAGAAQGQCVEDTQFMRRNHMELLKHHRDRTVREGVRTTQHSLANCVGCHASPETGRVIGSKDAFCERCHRFTAVKLDCFECHSDRPGPGLTAGIPR